MLSAFAPTDQAPQGQPSVEIAGDSESTGLQQQWNPQGKRLLGVPVGRVLLSLNQLAVMSQNGVEIADALLAVSRTCPDTRLQESLLRIHDAVSNGSSLSASVGLHGTYFPNTLAPMLAAAEATGDVPLALQKVCDRMREQMDLRGAIMGTMIYPFILIFASMVVLAALILGVLPQFKNVFESMGKEVPAYTQVLLDIGVFSRSHWPIITLVVLAIPIVLLLARRHPFVHRITASVLMHGPLISGAYRILSTGRTFRTIAAMVKGGIPMLDAVRLTRSTTTNAYWHDLLDQVEQNLIDGLPASAALASAEFLPPEASQMMHTGERTGRVAEVLEDVGTFYEQEGARKIKRLVTMLEPVIILCLGVLVAGIVLSVVLPMLDISTIDS